MGDCDGALPLQRGLDKLPPFPDVGFNFGASAGRYDFQQGHCANIVSTLRTVSSPRSIRSVQSVELLGCVEARVGDLRGDAETLHAALAAGARLWRVPA